MEVCLENCFPGAYEVCRKQEEGRGTGLLLHPGDPTPMSQGPPPQGLMLLGGLVTW